MLDHNMMFDDLDILELEEMRLGTEGFTSQSTGSTLKEILNQRFTLEFTSRTHKVIHGLVSRYEFRDNHPQAFNTALIGVDKAHFFNHDILLLFEVFNVDYDAFKQAIKDASGIDNSHAVASDTFNLFVVFIIHKVHNSKLPLKDKIGIKVLVLQYLHYKFFTSLINHYYKHGAKQSVMTYTIDNLSGKFSIKDRDTSTWRKLIAKRCDDIVDRRSPHWKTFEHFTTDGDVTYVLSDTQTNIRLKIGRITEAYYNNDAAGNTVDQYGIVEDIGGEESLRAITQSFDIMIETISNDALNLNRFIDNTAIDLIVKLTNNVNQAQFRTLLMRFSDMAVSQVRQGKHRNSTGEGEHQIITGYRELVSAVIQLT